ncbi:MAG: hypothetical protein JO334_06740 [Verrucomicrobia bacterium]|nr:hypothetical protein [Verrucomicrobiota bacterium]
MNTILPLFYFNIKVGKEKSGGKKLPDSPPQTIQHIAPTGSEQEKLPMTCQACVFSSLMALRIEYSSVMRKYVLI